MLERRILELRAIGRAGTGSEEPAQRRLELRGGIALALRREEQRRAIRFALPAAQEPATPMAQAEPCALLGERLAPGRGQ